MKKKLFIQNASNTFSNEKIKSLNWSLTSHYDSGFGNKFLYFLKQKLKEKQNLFQDSKSS